MFKANDVLDYPPKSSRSADERQKMEVKRRGKYDHCFSHFGFHFDLKFMFNKITDVNILAHIQ